MLVVNTEISKNGDFGKRKMSQDVLHFKSQIVKEMYVAGGVTERYTAQINLVRE